MARKWNAVAIPAWSPLEEGQASHKDSPYSWRQYALYPNRNQPSERAQGLREEGSRWACPAHGCTTTNGVW